MTRNNNHADIIFTFSVYFEHSAPWLVLDIICKLISSLRWFKAVSTFSRDLVIRRIDTTQVTRYHVTAMLSMLYMVPCETSIIAEQDAVIFVPQKVTMSKGKPCKNTLYFGFNCSYLKNEHCDPNFLLHESDQQGKMKFSLKLKKKILWNGFRLFRLFRLFKC